VIYYPNWQTDGIDFYASVVGINGLTVSMMGDSTIRNVKFVAKLNRAFE